MGAFWMFVGSFIVQIMKELFNFFSEEKNHEDNSETNIVTRRKSKSESDLEVQSENRVKVYEYTTESYDVLVSKESFPCKTPQNSFESYVASSRLLSHPDHEFVDEIEVTTLLSFLPTKSTSLEILIR